MNENGERNAKISVFLRQELQVLPAGIRFLPGENFLQTKQDGEIKGMTALQVSQNIVPSVLSQPRQ